MPDGRPQLLINLDEDEFRLYEGPSLRRVVRTRGAVLCGAHGRSFVIDTLEQRRVMGVSFEPGGARPFFAAPACATRNLHVELGDLWGRSGELLRERLLEATDPLALLEALLVERIVHAPVTDRDPVVDFGVRALHAGATVRAITDRLDITPARFVRRFSRAVGLKPKRYARVTRMQRALDLANVGHHDGWADIAYRCGYYDQAHLIRDFRELGDVRPSRYQPRSPDSGNHVPLPD